MNRRAPESTDVQSSPGAGLAGYAALAVAAVLWAAGGTTARYLSDRGASVLELTEARAWIAVATIGLLRLVRGPRESETHARGRLLPLVAVFGLAVAAANLTYYMSVELLPVAVAIVVQYTAPGLVVVWTAFARRRVPAAMTLVALGVALAGVVALSGVHRSISGHGRALHAGGLALAGVAAVSFATYIVVGERLGRALGSERAVLYGFAVASVLWVVVQAFRGRPDTLLNPRFAAWVMFLGVLCTVAPFLMFVWGLERVDASRAGIVSTLEPLAAAGLAFVWLGQRLSVAQTLGGAMVVAGIAIVLTDASDAPPARVETS